MKFNSLNLVEKANKIKKQIDIDIKNGKIKGLSNKIKKYEKLKKQIIKSDTQEQRTIIDKAKKYSINEIDKSTKYELLSLKERAEQETKELEKEIKILKESI